MKGVVTDWKNKSTVEIETDCAITTSTDDTSFIASKLLLGQPCSNIHRNLCLGLYINYIVE